MPPLKTSATFRSFRHRNYQLFFGGQLISLTGTWMQNVAQAWLVYRLTGSALLLGTVGFANQIPVFLLSPLGGVAADRWRRRPILIGTQTSSMLLAFALAAVTLFGIVRVWEIAVLAALLGVVNAFDIPARQAFVVEMVGREDLTNAIALNSSLFNGARIAGPAVAGVLVAAIGEGWCFFANAVSYIAVIAGLALMRLPGGGRAPGANGDLTSIAEGFQFSWRVRPIRALLLLLGIVSLTGMPYAVLMPVMASSVLHSGAIGLGTLMGASGVGALAGAIVLASKQGLSGLGHWVVIGAAGFGTALIGFGMSPWFWVSAGILTAVGFSSILQMATSNTLIQAMVPDHLRGRVMSVYSMMFMGMAPIGSLGAGAAASAVGAPRAITIGGAVCLIAAVIFWTRLSSLRPYARQLILAQQMAGGDPAQEMTGGPRAIS